MALDAGSLRVKLQYAKDIKDCDFFGKQDPYVRLRVGSQERRSRVCYGGGRSPVWDETFDFSIINENTLELTLLDEDNLKSDDLIGSCTVSLARAREQGRDVVQAPVSSGKKIHKQKGFVQVSLEFTPNSKLKLGATPMAPPMPQPAAPVYGYPAPSFAAPAPHPAPYGYGYPPAPAPAPAYAPSPSFYASPSFHYSPSFGHGAPAPYPPPPVAGPPAWSTPAPAAAPGWPAAQPHGYGMQTPAPAYYPPPSVPASAPAYGAYSSVPSYRY